MVVAVDAPLHPVGGFGWRGAAIVDPSLVWLAPGASALRAVLRRAGLWGDRNEHGTYGGVLFPQWLHIPAADAATWRGGDYALVVHWPTNWAAEPPRHMRAVLIRAGPGTPAILADRRLPAMLRVRLALQESALYGIIGRSIVRLPLNRSGR